VRRFVALKHDRIVAWFGLGYFEKDHPEYELNGRVMQGNLTVLSEFERQGIGLAMFKEILKVGREQGIKIVSGGADNDKAFGFIKKHGAKITVEGAENRLQMEDVDWDLMQTWINEGPTRAKGVEIRYFDRVPEEIFTEFLLIFNEGLNLQPLGESSLRTNISEEQYRDGMRKNQELGTKNYTYISVESDGRISGMTELHSSKEREYKLDVGLTTVRPEFRGRGLGKWLKAQMMFFVKENFPDIDYISTGNATTNEPMLSINNRMGFKEFKGGSAVEFDIEKTCAKLGI